jgi:hypothetical protein
VQEEESILRGDTLTLTFFPENGRDWIIDPSDGAIHTLIYVNGILKTVGQNDYIEYDVDVAEVAKSLTILKGRVQESEEVTSWLSCQLSRF